MTKIYLSIAAIILSIGIANAVTDKCDSKLWNCRYVESNSNGSGASVNSSSTSGSSTSGSTSSSGGSSTSGGSTNSSSSSSGSADKPGWGNGDKNHDHSGPPGKNK